MTSVSEAITQLKNTTASINGTSTQSGSSTGSSSSVNSQNFLNLMCMQLQYQDPTNPMDNSEMLAQEAQFASLEQMEALTSSFTTFSTTFQANSLMGQYVEVTDESGKVENGYVDYINLNDKDGASVSVNGTLRPLSQITKVLPADKITSDSIYKNTNDIKDGVKSIADSITSLTEALNKYLNKGSSSDSSGSSEE